eukprot:g39095.t1
MFITEKVTRSPPRHPTLTHHPLGVECIEYLMSGSSDEPKQGMAAAGKEGMNTKSGQGTKMGTEDNLEVRLFCGVGRRQMLQQNVLTLTEG